MNFFKLLMLNMKSSMPFFYSSIYKKKGIKILDIDATIEIIISKKISISRFGDGEISIMTNNHGVGFQEKNKALADRLYKVFISLSPALLICLPDQLNYINNSVRKTRKFWMSFLPTYQGFLLQNLDKNKIYGNSHITRFYINYKNKVRAQERFKNLKKIWDGKDILMVEGEFTRSGIGNDLFTNCTSVCRIICPGKNAFNLYDKIFQEIEKNGKDKLILLSLGPTATVLAHDLTLKGYWALDLGHLDVEYMWMLNKTKAKTNIRGRYINEMDGKLHIEELDDQELHAYQSQIISKILS